MIGLKATKRRCFLTARIVPPIALAMLVSTNASAQDGAKPQPALGPGFALIFDQSGQQGCLPRPLSQQVLTDIVLAQNEELGVDPEIAVVLSLDVPTCASIFYVAVANDIQGIGYGHFFDTELFDNSPERALSGIAFLNDLPYWEEHQSEWTRAFLHEVGHRWSARIRVSGDDPLALLGRDSEHWSYFLTSGEDGAYSPLEGNLWEETGDGEFSTRTHDAQEKYSRLDLYLMGLLAPEEVGPLSVLIPDNTSDLLDCDGAPLSASSPPQTCESQKLAGSPVGYSIDDVIAVEGMRSPAAETITTKKQLTLGFYLFAPLGTPLSEERCQALSAQVDLLADAFDQATGDRVDTAIATDGAVTCAALAQLTEPEELDEPTDKKGDSSCSFSPPTQGAGGASFVLPFALWISRRTRSLAKVRRARS